MIPAAGSSLDTLYDRDGQTLGELCAVLPEMTRYGVMNHLRVLEEAELVITRKQGRSKFHFLFRRTGSEGPGYEQGG